MGDLIRRYARKQIGCDRCLWLWLYDDNNVLHNDCNVRVDLLIGSVVKWRDGEFGGPHWRWCVVQLYYSVEPFRGRWSFYSPWLKFDISIVVYWMIENWKGKWTKDWIEWISLSFLSLIFFTNFFNHQFNFVLIMFFNLLIFHKFFFLNLNFIFF